MVYFKALVDAQELKAPAYGRMLDLLPEVHALDLAPDYPVVVTEKGRQVADAQVTVMADAARKDAAAVILVPRLEIGASAEEAHTVWSARDYHRTLPEISHVIIAIGTSAVRKRHKPSATINSLSTGYLKQSKPPRCGAPFCATAESAGRTPKGPSHRRA